MKSITFHVKLLWLLFGQLLEKYGLLFNSASGQSDASHSQNGSSYVGAGGCQSSVESSSPTMLRSRVRILCNFTMFEIQFMYLAFELECEKNENKQKRVRQWLIFEMIQRHDLKILVICFHFSHFVFDKTFKHNRDDYLREREIGGGWKWKLCNLFIFVNA